MFCATKTASEEELIFRPFEPAPDGIVTERHYPSTRSSALYIATTSPENRITSTSHGNGSNKILEMIPPLPVPKKSMSRPEELPLIYLALAGSVTTFFADLTMHPVDCIKTLQQSDLGVHMSILEATRYLYEQYGISGFLHGFLTYATSDAVGGCLKFSVWETWKKRLPAEQDQQPGLLFVMAGAALSFVAASVIIVPGEFLKQQLQMSHYHSLWEAIQGVAASEQGLAGFYSGYDGVLYRDIPYTILELGLYDMFKRTLAQMRSDNDEGDKSVIWDQLACAAMTGAITALVTTPMDVVKTKLMVDDYASFGEAFLSTYQNHGFEALYSGLTARVGWVIPFTVIYLPTYDFLKNMLEKRHLEHHLENREMKDSNTS
eukprot:CAMPEP_0198144190 /NCGR_PEP_ID=MMETSP1443-20131203/13980_1 /TAXON_ID=186043 /ORGANISM="Entomoneis sp., Strain CCMP2396" /LENGTH=375 /DNA_ID=CAMNT_0043807543 /DNA_START=121 /DNA_END=1249 /DNA_ORIENTATION=+